jgi:hypothetical protein
VLRVLVAAEVRQDAAGTVLTRDPLSDPTNDRYDVVEQPFVRRAQVYEGRNVLLRNDDDVDGPEGLGVMEGQDAIGFLYDSHRCAAAEGLLAVEVVTQCFLQLRDTANARPRG